MKKNMHSPKAYILVIDDDPLLRKTLKNILEREGYFVDLAQDGHEGIAKAKSGFFHLVLCDIRMPGLDGLMTIHHIQKFQDRAGTGKSGFVVITAYDAPESRQTAFQLGVSDFVMKPFDLDGFLAGVRRQVERAVSLTPLEEVQALNRRLERLLALERDKPVPVEDEEEPPPAA